MRNTIEAGEEMLYSDKEIHFDESLTIEGRAVFENCKIYCCENGNGSSMEIEEDGELEFINCEIIFCGIGVSKRKNYEFCLRSFSSSLESTFFIMFSAFSKNFVNAFFILTNALLIFSPMIIKKFFNPIISVPFSVRFFLGRIVLIPF